LCLDFNKYILAITILRLTLKQYNCEVSQANLDNFIKNQNFLDILSVNECEERILSTLCNYENENGNEAMNDELSSDYCSPEKKLLSGELDLIKEINDVTPQKITVDKDTHLHSNDVTPQKFNVDKDTHLHSLTEKVNDFKKCLVFEQCNYSSQCTHYNSVESNEIFSSLKSGKIEISYFEAKHSSFKPLKESKSCKTCYLQTIITETTFIKRRRSVDENSNSKTKILLASPIKVPKKQIKSILDDKVILKYFTLK